MSLVDFDSDSAGTFGPNNLLKGFSFLSVYILKSLIVNLKKNQGYGFYNNNDKQLISFLFYISRCSKSPFHNVANYMTVLCVKAYLTSD